MNNSVSTTTGKVKLKIVFLGNQSVGKSSIIEKYIHDRFDQTANPTVGIDFLAKNVTHQNKTYRLQLWDTAGQQRFRSLIPNYLKDAQYAFIIFDLTNQKSLDAIHDWVNLYNQNKNIQGVSIMIGNKVDLPREISYQTAKLKAEQLGMKYFEISAKTGDRINDCFIHILDHQFKKLGISPDNIKQPPSFKKRQKQSTKEITIKEEKQQEHEQSKNRSDYPDQTAAKIKEEKPTQNSQQKEKKIVLNKENIKGQNKSAANKGGCC